MLPVRQRPVPSERVGCVAVEVGRWSPVLASALGRGTPLPGSGVGAVLGGFGAQLRPVWARVVALCPPAPTVTPKSPDLTAVGWGGGSHRFRLDLAG